MNYPLISEYIEAIKSAEDNFEELSYLRPVLGDDGLPVMTSGNFAVVFKMKDEQSGKFYAVKCFTKEQEGRAEAYREIAKELENVSSPYILSIRYLEKELFVDTDQTTETEFPVLLMDWVEGKTLDKYLRENLDDKYALEMLAYHFSQLAQWLIPQPFAHGDLKPDNILVREDGTLVLVDYDGMYVPAMKGQKARELGSPDFRHPLRTENDFDEHIDDFPITSILISLKTALIDITLLADNIFQHRLLFSENDYRDIYSSDTLRRVFPSCDREINQLVVAFLHYIMYTAKTRYPILYILNYCYLPEKAKFKYFYYDLPNKYVDEYGVEYTSDKKVLLCWKDINNKDNFPTLYRVCEGTEIICDDAFGYCKNLSTLYLPKSLKYIGEYAFEGTNVSKIICESPKFDIEDDILYSYDRRILYYYPKNKKDLYFEVPIGVKKIIGGCFSNANYLQIVKLNHICYEFSDFVCFSNIFFSIPLGTKRYLKLNEINWGFHMGSDDVKRTNIFEGDLIVDDGVVYSSDKSILYRYPYWLNREEYRIDENCKIIEEAAFDDSIELNQYGMCIRFNNLKRLYLPYGLEEIKDYAFAGCGRINNLTIPYSVKKIGNYVFGQCVNLITITFLSKIEDIGEKAFHIGKTMPADLVNPYYPFVSLKWVKNEIDIVICPKRTEEYYKIVLENDNSKICVLTKDEPQIRTENPDNLKDRDFFSPLYIVPFQISEMVRNVICENSINELYNNSTYILSKILKLLPNTVFTISKATNRFYGCQDLNGICYLTRNYRARFVSENVSFDSIDDAIDFVCRIYLDASGEIDNNYEDLPF